MTEIQDRAERATNLHLQLLDERVLGDVRQAVYEHLGVAGQEFNWVDMALGAARPAWLIAGRAAPDALFGGATLLVAGGAATEARDGARAAARPVTRADVEAFCRVADALPLVSMIAPPAEADSPAARLSSVALALSTAGKHVVAVCERIGEAAAVVEMAKQLAGDESELRRRPLATIALLPGGTMSAANVAIAAGLPCLIGMSPAFLDADDRRQALAESFAAALGVVAGMLAAHPGAALGLMLPPGGARLLDAASWSGVAAAAQLARSFGVPFVASALATHAAAPDWLASAENTFAALTCCTARAAGLAGAGLLDGGASMSLHELVMDAEIFSYCSTTAAGIPVDEETIALPTIESIGIGGNALGARHTRRHLRDVWRPTVFDRSSYEAWQREGRRQSYELACELLQRILGTPATAALPGAAAAELMTIAQEAGKETT